VGLVFFSFIFVRGDGRENHGEKLALDLASLEYVTFGTEVQHFTPCSAIWSFTHNYCTCCSFHETREKKENSHKHLQAFLHKLNAWNSSLNFTCPPPAHLKYQYPPPTLAVLHNISCTLASVPKFYTQVLHLMNKMNLPCPFQPMPFPTPEILSGSVPSDVMEENDNALPEATQTVELTEEEEEEEESELESDEGQQLPTNIIPAKRPLPHKLKKVKRPKFIKPVPATTASAVRSVKAEEVFEKVTCEPVQRKIELKFSTAVGGDGVAEKVDEQGTCPSGGFGLLFPVTKNADEVQLVENVGNTQEELLTGSTITAEELEANRISSRGKCNVFLFRSNFWAKLKTSYEIRINIGTD
jgi:U11/U12 small nuclear ribonucleoprotein SNRNP65